MRSIGAGLTLVLGLSLSLSSGCGTGRANAGADGESSESGSDTGESADTGDTGGESGDSTGGDFLPEPDLGGGGAGGLGDECASDNECMDPLFCHGLPMLPQACSECTSDADCVELELGLNCYFNGMYFACGEGEAGQQCEEDASCMDPLKCAEVLDFGGFFNGNFCSECESDSDCSDGQICNPEFGMMSGGQKKCVDPGSIPNDEICDFEGSGDMACASGHCEDVAAFMGFVHIGVCGECEDDSHCDGGTCMGGTVSMMFEIAGSTCG